MNRIKGKEWRGWEWNDIEKFLKLLRKLIKLLLTLYLNGKRGRGEEKSW